MTRAKRQALALLAAHPCVTWRNTTGSAVSGRVAACLVRERLARYVTIDGFATGCGVEITNAGRAALAAELEIVT